MVVARCLPSGLERISEQKDIVDSAVFDFDSVSSNRASVLKDLLLGANINLGVFVE